MINILYKIMLLCSINVIAICSYIFLEEFIIGTYKSLLKGDTAMFWGWLLMFIPLLISVIGHLLLVLLSASTIMVLCSSEDYTKLGKPILLTFIISIAYVIALFYYYQPLFQEVPVLPEFIIKHMRSFYQ